MESLPGEYRWLRALVSRRRRETIVLSDPVSPAGQAFSRIAKPGHWRAANLTRQNAMIIE
jgi:hypothetical protein